MDGIHEGAQECFYIHHERHSLTWCVRIGSCKSDNIAPGQESSSIQGRTATALAGEGSWPVTPLRIRASRAQEGFLHRVWDD